MTELKWKEILTVDRKGIEYGKEIHQVLKNLDKYYSEFYVLSYLSHLGIKEARIDLELLCKFLRPYLEDSAKLVIVDDVGYECASSSLYLIDFEERVEENSNIIDLKRCIEDAFREFCKNFYYIFDCNDLINQKFFVLSLYVNILDPLFLLEEFNIDIDEVGIRGEEISRFFREMFERFDVLCTVSSEPCILGVETTKILEDERIQSLVSLEEEIEKSNLSYGTNLEFSIRILNFLEVCKRENDIIFVDSFIGLEHKTPIVVNRFIGRKETSKLFEIAELGRKGEVREIFELYKSYLLRKYRYLRRYSYLLI